VGWDVADVVLHLTQTDEWAIESATGNLAASTKGGAGAWGQVDSIDATAAMLVEQERGLSTTKLVERWSAGTTRLIAVLKAMDLSTRVMWVVGDMSARTLATARLAETWIHTGDVADALNVPIPSTDRLRLIARLAWRTLPYAFGSAGRTMTGPVAFRLASPSGEAWDFLPDEPAATTISGTAADLCAVAARRVDPSTTSLRGDGPDAADVLALVRTYA
jgi:uncharacterized protein (TIGR03084 family)